MNDTRFAQLPSSPFLNDSTNTINNLRPPWHENKRNTVDPVNENLAFSNDPNFVPMSGQIPPAGAHALNEGEKYTQLFGNCLPPWMKRKLSPVFRRIEDRDSGQFQAGPRVNDSEPVTCEQPPNLIGTTSNNKSIQTTRPQAATRSSVCIRAKRDLANAPIPGPQQKKRKRDESQEPVSQTTPAAPLIALETEREATAPLVIRIPAISFALDIKIDHTAELKRYPTRIFPIRGIPVYGNLSKLKGGKFHDFPLRHRRMLTLYATQKIIFGSRAS